MSEKLQDAIHKMNPGDKFTTPDCESDVHCVESNLHDDPDGLPLFKFDDGPYVKMVPKVMLYEGGIIQAEQTVLTADEWLRKDDTNLFASWKCVFEGGRQNGRLEMYLEVKPSIEQYRQLLARITDSAQVHSPNRAYDVGVISEVWIDEQLELLENLKPLNKDSE